MDPSRRGRAVAAVSVSTLRRLLLGLRRVVLHPAVACGLVLLLLYPLVTSLIADRSRRAPVETSLEAERSRRAAESARPEREPATPSADAAPRGPAPEAASRPSTPGRSSGTESGSARARRRVTLSRVGTPVELELGQAQGGLALRMRPPHFSERGAAARVRIVSPDASRELQEAASVGLGDGMVEIRIPEGWLEPGAYRVEVTVGEPGSEAQRLILYRFRVR